MTGWASPRWVLIVAFAIGVAACTSDGDPTPVTVAPAGAEATTTSSSAPDATLPLPTTTTAVPTSPPPSTLPSPDVNLVLDLEPIASGFDQPVFVTHAPGDPRLFVVDQPGRIWVIEEGEATVFLDIRDRVGFGGERGLLGMAFHPDFAENGRFYLDLNGSDGNTRIVEFTVSEAPDVADEESSRALLTIDQPAGNHNGGMIAFGPDGYLWIGMGDGGAANDRYGNGQRADTLLGAMLRIDVGPGAPDPYGIPPDNPFADGADGAPEVWAIGLRNPWRWSFDGTDLWIGDVGQGTTEEVDHTATDAAGLNYGWPVYEGTGCFGSADDCTGDGFVFPVHEYGHDEGCSITGGYVYRGSALPELTGHYFFSDFCSGFIHSIDPDGAVHDWTDDTGIVGGATSFGVDDDGEIYVVNAEGTVDQLVRATP